MKYIGDNRTHFEHFCQKVTPYVTEQLERKYENNENFSFEFDRSRLSLSNNLIVSGKRCVASARNGAPA